MRTHSDGRRGRRGRVALAVLTLLVVLVAGACGGSGDSDSSREDTSSGAGDSAGATDGRSAGDSSGAAAAADEQTSALPDVTEGRDVILTASLTVTVEQLDRSVERAERIVGGVGGVVFGEESSRAENPRSVLTLKVPPAAFQSVLDDLAEIGDVDAQHLAGEDVTSQVVDLESRIATSSASVDRLRALILRAEDIDDIAILEGQLLERETTLEQLRGQQRTLEDQVGLATITLTLQPTPDSPDTDPDDEDEPLPGFLDSLSGGANALILVGSVILLLIGALLPWVPVLIIAAIAYHFGRRRFDDRAAAKAEEQHVAAMTAHLPPPPAPVGAPAGAAATAAPTGAPMGTRPPDEGQSLS